MTSTNEDGAPPVGPVGSPPSPSPHRTPFGAGIPLGHWGGVAVKAHWSTLVTLALFAELLAASVFPTARHGESPAVSWAAGILTSAAFLVTLLAHELAHAITARHFGLPVRSVTLWMLGGLTELGGEPTSPRADALVAASGPATSLGIGAVCALVAAWVGTGGIVGAALAWLAGISVLLAVFNLLPGAPLDGGRLLRAFLWWRTKDRERAVEGAARAGRALGFALVALGLVEFLAGGLAGLWLALIGWFISAGSAGERAAARGAKLTGRTVRDIMNPSPDVAPDWWTVTEFLERIPPERAAQLVFPLVGMDGRLTGAVTIRDLGRVPAAARPMVRLREIRGLLRSARFAPTTPLSEVLPALHAGGGIGIVVEDERPVGIITEADLARAIQLAELGWTSAQHTRSG